MKINNKKQLQELLLLGIKIKSILKNNLYFKKLYESNNPKNKKDNEKYIIITNEKDKNIFSGIPNDVIEYLELNNKFDMKVFDTKNSKIPIEYLWELYDTIKNMISIFEFECYLNKKYFEELIDNPI
jgi:hypothetical protein